MKLLWCTDTHLDFLPKEEIERFGQHIAAQNADAVVLTGDISNAMRLMQDLSILTDACAAPFFTVLGNHDYYGSSINAVRDMMRFVSATYLTTSQAVGLTDKTAIVGHDGWYDLYNGVGTSSSVVLNDFMRIHDFRPFFYQGAVEILARELARDGAAHVAKEIDRAAKEGYSNIVIATHFPPWAQASQYHGKQSDDEFLPFYSSKLMGLVLNQAAINYPNIQFVVLAGHTHGYYDAMIHPNMRCMVGAVEYESPQIQTILEIE